MAMLAEPRRKQRWSLNPNGRAWTDDGSKIGQKMLEKMGWSKGNGLGKSQNGMTDPIKVKANSNQTGLGFAGVSDTVWVQHQDDFNSLLSKLSQSAEAETPAKQTEDEPKSLEVMSKASTKRIHYHKFTKSKDLKKATAQDLASIFGAFPGCGPKANSAVNSGDEASNDAPEPSEESTDKKAPNFGVVTIHGGCLNEYFNRKRAAKSGVDGEVVSVKVENEEIDEKKVESENASNGEEIANVIDYPAEEVEEAPKKKSKKKKLAEEIASNSQQDVSFVKIKKENVSDAEDVPPVEAPEPPKKKSKRKIREEAAEDVPDVVTIKKEVKDENLAEDEQLPSVKTEAEPQELPKKKVKKEKLPVPDKELRREEPEDVELLSEVPSKLKKKKKEVDKCSVKIENEVKKEHLAASETSPVVEEFSSKKKKKRKVVDEADEVSEPLKKKKKIKAEIPEAEKTVKEVVLLDSVQPEPQADGKLKKKKKKSEGNAEVPQEKAFSVAPLIRRSAQQIVAYELLNKKKKSKKPPQEQLDSAAANFRGANLHEVNGYPNKKKMKAAKVKEEAA